MSIKPPPDTRDSTSKRLNSRSLISIRFIRYACLPQTKSGHF